MFYSNFIYAKKGPLAKVWLAAHFTSKDKLKKADIAKTNVSDSAKSILDEKNPLALRLRGQLLLGLVRIYEKQVKYLQADCSEALTKMKMISRPSAVDLDPDNRRAKEDDINLPMAGAPVAEMMYDDFDVSELMMLADEQVGAERSMDLSVARAGDITLQDRGGASFVDDRLAGLADELESFVGDESLIDFENIGMFSQEAAAEDFSRADSMEVEVGRDALEASRMNDSNIATAHRMSFENSNAEISEMDQMSFEMEEPAMELEPSVELEARTPAAKRAAPSRKRKPEPSDRRADIEGSVIQRNLRDPTGIIADRKLLHTSKRAKFYDADIQDILVTPTFSMGTMAPQLLRSFGHSLTAGVPEGLTLRTGADEEIAAGERSRLELDIVLDEDVMREDVQEFEMDMPDIDLDGASFNSTTIGVPSDVEAEEAALEETNAFFEEEAHVEEVPTEEDVKEWSSRTKKTLLLLKNHMDDNETVDTNKLLQGCSRPTAAAVFYQILVLKTHNYLDVVQDSPYDKIIVSKVAA